MKKAILVYLLLILSITLHGQDFTMEEFEGTVYEIPATLAYRTFDTNYIHFPEVKKIYYEKLNFQQREMQAGFPGIPTMKCFGIMFSNTLTIHKNNHFRFSLSSDDGSILWLNDKELINNDYSNGMHIKSDTFYLTKGDYQMKIWYFQAYPTKLGLIFEMDTVQGYDEIIPDTISFENSVLFDLNSYNLKQEAKILLDKICEKIENSRTFQIKIIGHTDNSGSYEYNLKLSQSRANVVMNYILNNSSLNPGLFESIGKSFTDPVASNKLPEGRSQNRRVEIIIF